AADKGRDVLLRNRAMLISDYEALGDIRFRPPEPELEYIVYVGHSKSFEDWSEGRKHFRGDEFSLLKYEMDKKYDTSIPNEFDTSLPLDKGFKEFQQRLNKWLNRLDETAQKVDELRKNMQTMFKEIMEKIEN
ncbi:13177_t:CDS:2, partial [Funneliformis geosporum]